MMRRWRTFILSIVVGAMLWGPVAWASTRIGNAELQMWYRTRNTFQSNGGDHLNWVQWRNEVYFWFIYDKFVDNGKILGQDKLQIPFVENATLNARYRFRADPVWTLRKSLTNKYDPHERKSYLFPENGFRDLFLDLDFGDVGPGKLSARIGNQQIVWGESDLFRSIDVINPLRIDQNQGAGEKFDEFRTPIMAFKLNYNIGNVGSWFSNVYIEPFFTPDFRGLNSDLIINGVLRSNTHIKGCLDDNNNLIPYSASNCSFRRSDGSRVFVPWDPSWIGQRRTEHPWAFIARSPNPRDGTVDFGDGSGRGDIPFAETTYLPEVYKGNCKGPLNGMWLPCTMAGGFRIFGTSIGGFDFSLNYANIPQGVSATFDFSDITKAKVYGDADVAKQYGLAAPVGSFEQGLQRCLNNRGIAGSARNDQSQTNGQVVSTILAGGDLAGYNNPARYGPNGALLPDGNVKPGKHNAVRAPITDCFPANFHWSRTNIIGLTSTYNDFEYTGAVFRLEESISTKEYVRVLPIGTGRNANPAISADAVQRLTNLSINRDYHKYQMVGRSMLGFDLLKSVPSFKYLPFIHHSFYDQAWFFTGQWLVLHRFDNVTNPLCYVVDNAGNGLTTQQAAALTAKTGQKYYSNSQCRNYRWNHLLTLAAVNQGLFASRVETRNAVAFEPRAQDWLLFSQWWWRNVMGYENIELSTGVAWYPGSKMSQGWTGLYAFAGRDQFWFEFTYYIL